jgi:hypothetical protein
VARYLVLGDPVIALGPAALIPDGALLVGGAEITAVGSREVLAARGPFDRVLGSADHFVSLVEPYLAPLYQPWYDVPVEPAHPYNARHVPGGGRRAD